MRNQLDSRFHFLLHDPNITSIYPLYNPYITLILPQYILKLLQGWARVYV